MKSAVKEIRRDCFRAMAPAWIVSMLQEVLTGLLSIWITTLVAGFMDAILQFDKEAITSGIWKILLGIFVSVFLFPLISYFCNILMLQRALVHDRKVMERFLRKKYDEAMKLSLGEAQSRLENDPNDYRIKWMELMTQYVSLPIVLSYLMYSSLCLNWQYTLVTIAFSAVRIFFPAAVRKLNAKYDKESRYYKTELRKCEMDITAQPHSSVMLGIKQGMLDRIDAIFWNYYKSTGRKRTVFGSVTSFLTSTIDTISWAGIIVAGAIFVAWDIVSAGTVAAMLGFSAIYDNIIKSVVYILKERLTIKTLIDRMLVLYDGDEMQDGEMIKAFDKLSVENLSYQYNDTPVFEPLSFSVCEGDKVAICGENGSGKSTLLHMLCGLNHGYAGSIMINERELSSISPVSLRSQISLTTQEPFLFPGTILENLTLGGLASKEYAIHILDEMGIAYLADRDISVKQDSLSVGEKQRISLSRAILKNTDVMFLDEPSNNLDENSIQKLKDFISTSSKTIIYVSHTDSLTELASKVIMVKKVKDLTVL